MNDPSDDAGDAGHAGAAPVEPPELDAFARLDRLVNWERRARRAAARFSLEPMRDLLLRLGSPERGRRSIHVAGSKGKGSVAALVARALREAGLRAGRYASPHVERIEERVEIDARDIERAELEWALERALAAHAEAAAEGRPGGEATWFDVVTAAALAAFARAEVDVLVLECGLGGRLDSTNAVDSELAIVTSIELEHTELLGSTRAAIAAEKAGVIKPGASLVSGLPRLARSGEVDPAWRALDERARAVGARWAPLPESAEEATWEALSMSARNERLAEAALDELGRRGWRAADGRPLAAAHLTPAARAAARLPARFERFERDGRHVVLDGAHTPRSVALVLEELARSEEFAGRAARGEPRPAVTAVLGLGGDKDLEGILKALGGQVDRLVCTSVASELARTPESIASVARALDPAAETAASPRTALERALELTPRDGWVLILGSLYLAGALRPLLTSSPAAC